MDAIELSSDVGLVAVGLLTLNLLLGLLMGVKYNPVREWPHRRIKTFQIHNWTGYIALSVTLLHPVLLLFSSTAGFRVLDLLVPLWAPKQPGINTIGALSLYAVLFVVVTSYFRRPLGRSRWKKLHYTAYGAAVVFYIHSILTDPTLKDAPIDYLDGEKVYIELCVLVVIAGVVVRIRHALREHGHHAAHTVAERVAAESRVA